MSIDDTQLSGVIGKTVYGVDGSKIGKVGQFFLNDVTGKLEWVTVQIGTIGGKENFVPAAQSEVTDDGLTVPFEKKVVKDAPQIDPEAGHITPDEEAMLYRHCEARDHSRELPVERVKLSNDTVTEEQQVTEHVRKEQIEMDGPDRDEH